MGLLTTKQYKLDKSQALGIITSGLNLAPADSAARAGYDIPTTCAMAGACAAVCLQFSGMNNMPTHAKTRIERTRALFANRRAFLDQMTIELDRGLAKAQKLGWKYAHRPNLLSDLPWLGLMLAERRPNMQFYDYTKIPKPWERVRPNYHLTYSYSERTGAWANVEEIIAHGVNVAIVFDRTKGEALPATYRGIPVLDGDAHDLRFLDQPGHIVGLRFKGARRKLDAAITGGFVLPATEP
jgi:hypothetical protein